MTLLRLMFEFFKTGLFAVGGGLATLPFLYEISDKTGWFSHADIADMIAISESTPGAIGINMSTYAGFKTAGVPGGILATLSLAAPRVDRDDHGGGSQRGQGGACKYPCFSGQRKPCGSVPAQGDHFGNSYLCRTEEAQLEPYPVHRAFRGRGDRAEVLRFRGFLMIFEERFVKRTPPKNLTRY